MKTLRAFGLAMTTLLFVTEGRAADYVTTVYGTSDATEFELNYIEVAWSTDIAFEDLVLRDDLEHLMISFYNNSNDVFYTDVIMTNGTMQSIGGVSRPLSNFSFSADSGMVIIHLDNDSGVLQDGATGTTFNIYGGFGDGDFMSVDLFLDGVEEELTIFEVTSHSTTTVPEPSTALLLVAGLALVLAARRRRVR